MQLHSGREDDHQIDGVVTTCDVGQSSPGPVESFNALFFIPVALKNPSPHVLPSLQENGK